MLHQPAKHHPSSISHFLALHTATTLPSTQSMPLTVKPKATTVSSVTSTSSASDLDDSETKLDSVNGNIGKSFTIAAILGLKKAAAAAVAIDNNKKEKELSVMNLSMHNMHNTMNSLKPTAFHAYENTDNNSRILSNVMSPGRIPISFTPHHQFNHLHHHHHHHQQQQHHQHRPSLPNHPHHPHRPNGASATSALQSLQQQFHQHNNNNNNNNNLTSFSGKEHRIKNENTSKNKSSLKNKRVRTIFTPEQLERLEAEFERQQYMVGPERLYLAHTLQLTEAQVKVWFQNRRIKWRKHHLELTQQRLAIIRQRQIPTSNFNETNSINGNMNGLNSISTAQQFLQVTTTNTAMTTLSTTTTTATTTPAELTPTTAVTIDSEVSVCTDSMDTDSLHEVDDL